MKHVLKTTVFAGLLGLGAVVAATGSASARYTTTSFYGDTCRVVSCDNDGDFCRTISTYDRDSYRRHYSTHSGYWRYRNGYYNNGYYNHRRWTCDADGDRCHWSDDDD